MMMIMMVSVEQLAECLAREIEVLSENLPQCRFGHHKNPHDLTRATARKSWQLTA
jgi:hypothetical protein